MIDHFEDRYHFLSNFHLGDVLYEGLIYPSIEHAFQAAKTLDSSERQKIRDLELPGQAKKRGRKVTLRPDWEDIKIDVMRTLVADKFRSGTELGTKLIDTHPHHLIEGNWWGDDFWGVCTDKGKNWLGQILMDHRDALIKTVGKVGDHV